MTFRELPGAAAWQHRAARVGFEVLFLVPDGSGYRLEGHTAAVERDEPWAVHYDIRLDDGWRTRAARIDGWSQGGQHQVALEADGTGGWRVDGRAVPELDGCLDVDLESSACTNTLPVHRLRLEVGQGADVPAAYVRAVDLGVERLEQRYSRVDDLGAGTQYDYRRAGLRLRRSARVRRNWADTGLPGYCTSRPLSSVGALRVGPACGEPGSPTGLGGRAVPRTGQRAATHPRAGGRWASLRHSC